MNRPATNEPPITPPPQTPIAGSAEISSFERLPLVHRWLRNTFSSLQLRNFRLFMIGQVLSTTGTWMRRAALGWLVYELTGSKALLGTVMAVALLPLFVLSPISGSLADRFSRKLIMIASQIISAVSSGMIAVLVATGHVQVWHIVVLAALGGVAFAMEVPARHAFVYNMVGKDQIANAIPLNSAMINLTRVLGPAAAGFLIEWVGIASCFAIDSLTYLVVVGCLLAIRNVPEELKGKPAVPVWRHLVEGAQEVGRNVRVRVFLITLALVAVFGWSFNTIMPAIAQDVLQVEAKRYGLLMAMFGLGALAGALVVASRSNIRRRAFQAFLGVWTMVAGLLIASYSTTFLIIIPPLLVAGFGAVLFISTANTIVQTSIPDSHRGRVMGYWGLTFGGSMPLGSFLIGIVSEHLGPMLSVRLFSLILLVGSLVIFFVLKAGSEPPESDPETS